MPSHRRRVGQPGDPRNNGYLEYLQAVGSPMPEAWDRIRLLRSTPTHATLQVKLPGMPEVELLFSYEIPVAMKYGGQTIIPQGVNHRPPTAKHLAAFGGGTFSHVPREAFDTMLAGLFQSIAIPLDKGVTVPIAAAKPEDLSDLEFEEDLYPTLEDDDDDEAEDADGWDDEDWDDDEEDEELDDEDEDEALRGTDPED